MYCSSCRRGCDAGDEHCPTFTKSLRCLANPFYRQPVLTDADVRRAKANPIGFWTRLNLMFIPTYCQITNLYAVFYKTLGDGRVFIMGYEALETANIDRLIDYVPLADDPEEKTTRTLY